MDRRDFLKSLGAAGATTLAASNPTSAGAITGDAGADPVGILVDTTRCAGCRHCEEVCAQAHGLPAPDVDDESVLDAPRTTSETQWSVITRCQTEEGDEIYVKRQCMHCSHPACASACLTRAMFKTKEGPIIWRESKCMGCRFCMVSCPFDVPKFEYYSAAPRIHKCTMCWERLAEGKKPACVEECPGDALTFGPRSELLAEARRRILENPGEYVDHIYGEKEAGGTGYLYLASVPFEKLGFRTDLGEASFPELTKEFLYGVPVVLTLFPALLLGMRNATKGKPDATDESEGSELRIDGEED